MLLDPSTGEDPESVVFIDAVMDITERQRRARQLAPAGGGSRVHDPHQHDGRVGRLAGSRNQAAGCCCGHLATARGFQRPTWGARPVQLPYPLRGPARVPDRFFRAHDHLRPMPIKPIELPLDVASRPRRAWLAIGLRIPACPCILGPISTAAIGPISAIQRVTRVRIGTNGAAHDAPMRTCGGVHHNLPGVALQHHTIGEGVTGQAKKGR